MEVGVEGRGWRGGDVELWGAVGGSYDKDLNVMM